MTQADDNQKPTFSANWTAGENSDGEIAAELATAYYEEPQPWQRDFLDVMLARDEHDKLLHPAIGISVPRQNGKMLAESTDIPTPNGWKKLRDIEEGDYVFGDDGKPARVIAKYESEEPNYYEIDFENAGSFVNETVRSGGGHQRVP